MTTIRPIFAAGRLRVSRIVYYRDLTDVSVKALPLGVMCDISAGPVYGLSLVARRYLSEESLEDVGDLMRQPLAEPFELLRKEFALIWADADHRAAAFADVVKRYSASLRFMPLQLRKIQVPNILRSQPDNLNDLTMWARDELCAIRNHEFWSLLGQSSDTPPKPNLQRGSLLQTVPPKVKVAA